MVRQPHPARRSRRTARCPWYAVCASGSSLQLALAGTFAWGAARSVTRPVGVLTTEAERIASGRARLAHPGPRRATRSAGSARRSSGCARALRARSSTASREANAELEARVEERTRELNDANEQLREREADRGQLLRKVITAQEDERKRIARELHDETTQSLAVLAMGLEAAQEAHPRTGRTPRLDEVKAVAVRTLEEVHRLILDLRPSVLDDLGLLSAIRWYAERAARARAASPCAASSASSTGGSPPELETALFRMCQEAMTQHRPPRAGDARCSCRSASRASELAIEIEDDGKGFDPAAVARREGRRALGPPRHPRARGDPGRHRDGSTPTPGQGTRVRGAESRCRRPSRRAPSASRRAGEEAGRPHEPKIRVLIADDHAILREGVRALLAAPGRHRGRRARRATARQAIAQVERSTPTSSSWTSPCPASAASRRRSS